MKNKLKCSDIIKKLSAFSADQLTLKNKELVSQHLMICPECRKALADLLELNTALDQFEDVEAKPYFTTRLKQRIADRAKSRRITWLRRALIPAGAMIIILVSIFIGNRLGQVVQSFSYKSTETTVTSSTNSGFDLMDGMTASSIANVSDIIFQGGDGE
jgi:predicted anti-sigma-YlaC factor YlaD